MIAESDEKLSQLLRFLSAKHEKKVIVYFLTCACVDFFWKVGLITTTYLLQTNTGHKVMTKMKKNDAFLEKHGMEGLKGMAVLSLHGKVPHEKRIGIYNSFQEFKTGAVLLATDLASRGLDVPDVDWVIQ